MDPQGSALQRACPWVFALIATLAALFLVWNVPPFMGPDEIDHFQRADLAAHGRMVGERLVVGGQLTSGGVIEPGIGASAVPFEGLAFHPERKANVAHYRQGGGHGWAEAPLPQAFPGSAAYPPFFYLPAAEALFVGHWRGWSVVQTLYLARLFQALACILTGFAALVLAGRSRFVLYAVLTLPMSLALFASVNADGLLIAVTALGTAVLGRATAQRPLNVGELAVAAICFAMVGMTKPPYALFALALLAVPAERPAARWWAAGAALAAALGWTAFTVAAVQTPFRPEGLQVDAGRQLALLLAHPTNVIEIAADTLGRNWRIYRSSVIGALGWADTFLPLQFYLAAWSVLVLAVLVAAPRRPAQQPAVFWSTLAIWLAVFGAIHLALYVTWTPVGAAMVEGVAGRYFLPLGCFLALALEGGPGLLPEEKPAGAFVRRMAFAARAAVLAFPLVGLALVERAVVVRYYLD
jgi:hypothetical protein